MAICTCEKCCSKRDLMRACLTRLHQNGKKSNRKLPSLFLKDLKDLLKHMNQSANTKSLDAKDLQMFKKFRTPLKRFVTPPEEYLNTTRSGSTKGQRMSLSRFISTIAQKYPHLVNDAIQHLQATH